MRKFPFLEPLPRAVELVTGEPPPRGLEVILSEDRVVALAADAVSRVSRSEYPWGGDHSVEESLASSVVFFIITALSGGAVAARLLEALVRSLDQVVEGLDARSLEEVLGYAGVKVERGGIAIPWVVTSSGVMPLLLQWRVHVSSFLGVAAGSGEHALALSNQFLLKGWVYLDIVRLRALARRALAVSARKRLSEAEEILSGWKPPGAIERLAALAKLKLGAEKMPYEATAIPPCIARIIGKLESGKGLKDEEAYTMLTFLARLDLPDIEEERIARLIGLKRDQLKRILTMASSYPVPSCSKLSKVNVCKCKGSLLEAYKKRLEEALSNLAGSS